MKTIQVQIPAKILRPIDKIQRFNGWPKARLIEQAMHFGVRRLALEMAVDLYAEGKIDLSNAASLANLSAGEIMEVLARRGVGSQLSEEDYFLAEQSASEFVKSLK
ncbi:MAG: UPF0175 family protein [Candidatus Cloacimonetes bacterium]|nr:UPF0175 family protein [Candidatus Cloacimonadota bacterium]